ncbi:MAG: MFS transporter [Thermoplasmata archaeon]|nr:MFS transporter [Thermoplasmata archaeon]
MAKSKDKGPFKPTKLTLVAMLLASMLMLMGGAAVAPALPLINAAFPDQTFAVSLIITLPSLAVGLTGMVLGTIADRYGKVRTLGVSLVVFTVAGVASFFLDDLMLILVMRFIVGVGIGGISAAVTALMAEYYMGAARVKVLSYQVAAMGMGVLILEYTGGSLAAFSWREPFLVYLIGIPILLLCIASMREPAFMQASEGDGEARQTRPANKRLILVLYIAIFVCQTMSFLLPTQMPTFLEDDSLANHLDASTVGLYLGANGVMNAIVALFYRRIVSHIRPFMIIGLGFGIMGLGMVAPMVSPNIYTALVTMILAGAGIGMICPAVTNTLAGEATSSTSGKIMGGYSTFLNFGQFAISLLSVPLLAMVSDSIPDLFGIMGIVAIVVAVVFVLYCAKDRRFSSQASGA